MSCTARIDLLVNLWPTRAVASAATPNQTTGCAAAHQRGQARYGLLLCSTWRMRYELNSCPITRGICQAGCGRDAQWDGEAHGQ